MLCGDRCNPTENKNGENLSLVLLVSFQPSSMTSEAWLWKTEQAEGRAFRHRDDSGNSPGMTFGGKRAGNKG